MSTEADVDAFVAFLQHVFVEGPAAVAATPPAYPAAAPARKAPGPRRSSLFARIVPRRPHKLPRPPALSPPATPPEPAPAAGDGGTELREAELDAVLGLEDGDGRVLMGDGGG